jgi:hypothetical protein
MQRNSALVVTSIAAPNRVLQSLAAGCLQRNVPFYVIGDVPSPTTFSLPGCEFYSLERQASTGLRFAAACPTRHYARKNIGYLLALRSGAEVIVETDDDNHPNDSFWRERTRLCRAPVAKHQGWVNAYAYFSDENIWPRGLPLDVVRSPMPAFESLTAEMIDAPVQQGLADENPDVDAIYRLVLPLPVKFRSERQVGLASGAWCPFNSQNTTWWRDTFPLLYLPAYCSFRMTDIWRSFVTQRIAWENGWHILFESPTVWQERNEHNLLRDFKDEVPGYLHNRAICEALESLNLKPGALHLGDNLRLCYEALVRLTVVGAAELELLEAWLADVQECGWQATA